MSDASCAPGVRVGAGPPRGGAEAGSEAGAAEAVRVLVGLDEFEVTGAVERDDGVLEVMVRARREEAACPRCGTFSGRVKQRRAQRMRDLHSFARPVVLVWDKRSFRCDTPGCVKTFTESTAQVPARKRLTERLRRGVAAAALDRSTAAVARSFRVGWHTAWDAVAAAAVAKLAARPPMPPRRLGVDETMFRRPRRFMTGIVDLETSRLWDMFEGRSKAALADRLRLLGDAASVIEAVVIDPFAPYRAAVRELLPHAVHAADRFHIERLANTALTDTRRRPQQDLTGHRGRKGDPLHTARRDLTRAGERLTERGRLRLDAAFDADDTLDLKSAWILKEALRDVYDSTSRRQAERELADWHRWAAVYDVEETNRLAGTLRQWETEILAYFDTGLTNGATEGRNLIVKQVKRQGFGYTNPHNYRLRVLYRCA